MYYNGHPDKADLTGSMSKGLYVISCGYDKFTSNDHKIARTGRNDFHIIYVVSGAGHFSVQGKLEKTEAGNIIIYRPMETYTYIYKKEEQAEVYWIHFQGSQAAYYTDRIINDERQIYNIGVSSAVKNIFENIIAELQLKEIFYYQAAADYLNILLVSIIRKKVRSSGIESGGNNSIKFVVSEINYNYAKNICLEEYSKMCNLSKSSFIAAFKKITGTTPIDYRNNIRIRQAKFLLANNNYSIDRIATLVGYRSVSYFSSIFKKKVGKPPERYKSDL